MCDEIATACVIAMARTRASLAREAEAPSAPTSASAAPIDGGRTTWWLLIAVFIDLFGVALVVPNLVFRFKELGVSPASYGAISSVYSGSQIVGGLIIGYLSDGWLGRKRAMLLSIVGAGVSYLIVGVADTIELLIVSRVVVGLVKQTMTCSTAIVADLTPDHSRAAALGRLSSASTLAFLVGQPSGGLLASMYGRRAPCYLAAGLFAFDFFLVQACIPLARSSPRPPPPAAARVGVWAGMRSFRSAFSGEGGRVLLLRLLYTFFMRASYALHSVYEQERWELTPVTTGYLSSYKMALGLLVNTVLVGALATRYTEAGLVTASLALSAANAALELSHTSFVVYAAVNLAVSAVAGAVTRTALSALFSKVVPRSDAGSATSVVDVLSSAVNVLAPLYNGLTLSRVGVSAQPAVAGVHYVALLMLVPFTLRASPPKDNPTKRD